MRWCKGACKSAGSGKTCKLWAISGAWASANAVMPACAAPVATNWVAWPMLSPSTFWCEGKDPTPAIKAVFDGPGLLADDEPEPKTAPKDGAAAAPEDEDAPASDAVSEPQKDKDGKPVFKSAPIRYDPVKQETLNLLGDLVDLTKLDGSTTAKKK